MSYNPRNDAAILCRNHPDEEAGAMWPWKTSDRLCMPCIYDAQAAAERASERDRARNFPELKASEDPNEFLYISRGRSK